MCAGPRSPLGKKRADVVLIRCVVVLVVLRVVGLSVVVVVMVMGLCGVRKRLLSGNRVSW